MKTSWLAVVAVAAVLAVTYAVLKPTARAPLQASVQQYLSNTERAVEAFDSQLTKEK